MEILLEFSVCWPALLCRFWISSLLACHTNFRLISPYNHVRKFLKDKCVCVRTHTCTCVYVCVCECVCRFCLWRTLTDTRGDNSMMAFDFVALGEGCKLGYKESLGAWKWCQHQNGKDFRRRKFRFGTLSFRCQLDNQIDILQKNVHSELSRSQNYFQCAKIFRREGISPLGSFNR